ncbi:Hypothetical predicted protein [Drosophila guanche]|nr:Hypothetical predicted protein [Drosophila guanche]
MPMVFMVHRKLISQMELENPDVEAPLGIGLSQEELENLGENLYGMTKIEVEVEKGTQKAAEVGITEAPKETPEGILEANAETSEEQESNLNLKENEVQIPEGQAIPETSEEKGIPDTPEDQIIQTIQEKEMELDTPTVSKDVANPIEKDTPEKEIPLAERVTLTIVPSLRGPIK